MNQIHGHEVLEMMMASGKTYTRATLLQDITDKFGPNTRFYTCSAEDLTAEQLLAFLQTRGKFVAQGDGFTTSPDLKCGGE